MRITFTYDARTEESAADGDVEDRGFYDPDGNSRWSLLSPAVQEEVESTPEIYNYDGGLEKAIEDAKRLGCSEPSNNWVRLSDGRISFSSANPDHGNFQGEETYYYVHFDGLGARSMRRVCEAFGVKIRD
jgi:hypothetical protein